MAVRATRWVGFEAQEHEEVSRSHESRGRPVENTHYPPPPQRTAGQRIAGRRCAAAAGGKGARRALESVGLPGVSGVLSPYGGATHGAAPTWQAQACFACSRSISGPLNHARPVPSLRAIRPADREPAVRCGGWGKGGRRRALGSCWARARIRGFSGVPPPYGGTTHETVPT